MTLGNTIVLFGFCVLSVFAVHPKLAPISSRSEIAQVTVRSHMSNVLSMAVNGNSNSTECTDRLENSVNTIANLSVSRLNSCYLSAEQGFLNASSLENANVVEVNNSANSIINRLTHCTQLNSTGNATNTDIFQCFVNDFDQNLKGIDEISSVSQLAIMQIDKISSSIQIEAFDCINYFTMEAKLNMTKAYNDELDCLKYGITTTPRPETTTPTWETPTEPNENH